MENSTSKAKTIGHSGANGTNLKKSQRSLGRQQKLDGQHPLFPLKKNSFGRFVDHLTLNPSNDYVRLHHWVRKPKGLLAIAPALYQKHTARLVLERSAQYAGFFEHGKERLVMPGVAPDERREPPKSAEPKRYSGGGAGGGGTPPRHPLIEGMFESLPPNGQPWTLDEAADWLHAAAYNLRFAYKLKGKITVDIKVEQLAGQR